MGFQSRLRRLLDLLNWIKPEFVRKCYLGAVGDEMIYRLAVVALLWLGSGGAVLGNVAALAAVVARGLALAELGTMTGRLLGRSITSDSGYDTGRLGLSRGSRGPRSGGSSSLLLAITLRCAQTALASLDCANEYRVTTSNKVGNK